MPMIINQLKLKIIAIFSEKSSFCGFSQWEIICCSGMLHFLKSAARGLSKKYRFTYAISKKS